MSYYHDMMTWVLQGGPIFFLCESVCADGPILRCVLFQICHAVDKGTFLLDIRPHVAHYVKYTSSMLWIVLAANPLFKHPCLFFNRAYPPPPPCCSPKFSRHLQSALVFKGTLPLLSTRFFLFFGFYVPVRPFESKPLMPPMKAC